MSEENVQVSNETIEKIDNEIQKVEDVKIEEAKAEGKQEATTESTIASLQEQLKQQGEMFQQMQNQLKEKADAEAQAKAEAEEKAKVEAEEQEQVKKKHIVAESVNPATPETQTQDNQVHTSPSQEWDAFRQAHASGFTATHKYD